MMQVEQLLGTGREVSHASIVPDTAVTAGFVPEVAHLNADVCPQMRQFAGGDHDRDRDGGSPTGVGGHCYGERTAAPAIITRRSDMAGKFEIYQDAGGQFRFRLKSGNGQVIASSEAYTTKKACLNGIASVRKHAGDAALIELV